MSPTPGPVSGRMRKAVYDLIVRYPGLHVRGVERELGTSAALAHYHLRRLEEAGFVESRSIDGHLRFFPAPRPGGFQATEKDRQILGMLREEVPLGIVLTLLDEGPLTHTELVDRLQATPSNLTYHLKKLLKEEVLQVVEPGKRYRVARSDRVYGLLLTYRPTPSLIDAFAEAWGDLYGDGEPPERGG